MRRWIFVALAFVVLSVAACDEGQKEQFVNAANAAADGATTAPVPWLNIVGIVGGVVLSALGARKGVAAYRTVAGAVAYPKTPFTPAEIEEIETGLVARGWKKP